MTEPFSNVYEDAERRALFPAHAGRLTVPGAALRCAAPDGEEIVPIPALEVLVDPLPPEGRPEGFGGLLGPVAVTARVTPRRVALGETLRVSVLVQGDTNVWDAPSPRGGVRRFCSATREAASDSESPWSELPRRWSTTGAASDQ